MTVQLKQALKAVRDQLQQEAHEHCTSFTVTYTSDGYECEMTMTSPGSVKRNHQAIRNLRGEPIGDLLPLDPVIVSREKAIEWLTTIKNECVPAGTDFGNDKIVRMCDQAIREMQS